MIDALLLRPPQLSGRLNATGTVTGTTDAPAGEGGISRSSKGGFRQFRYDSFGGTVNYAGTRDHARHEAAAESDDVDRRQGARSRRRSSSDAGSTSSDPIDLRVDSTPIDVGIVQGFTTALTDVTGTLEAHVHVTGTAADPRPDGAVTIQNAAFTLEPNGVTYTDLDGQIDLQPDRIHIEQIRVLDNQQEPADDHGRSGASRAQGRRDVDRRQGRRLQGHRQRDGERPGEHAICR